MSVDRKRLSKELKEAHSDVTLLASLATVGEISPRRGDGDGEMKTQDSKDMKAFLMSKNILPLQFELNRLKSAAPAASAQSSESSSGTGKDIPFAPEGINRWVGRMKCRLFFRSISKLDGYPLVDFQVLLGTPFH